MISDSGKDIPPKLVRFPSVVQEVLLRRFFHTAVLSMGDNISFAHGDAGSSIESQCFGLRLGGSLIHTCEHSVCGNRSNFGASDMLHVRIT